MASGWNLWVWLPCIGVVSGCCCKEVYNYIDILTIIINFPYSTCISSFLAAASLLLCSFLKYFFRSCKNKNKNKKPKWRFFTSRGVHLNCAIMRCYTLILLEISRRTRWWCLKCVIVYPARDIPPFVM